MSELFILNDGLEVVPCEGELELRLPLSGTTLRASRYQLGLLQQFRTGTDPSVMLKRFPYEREASERFLEQAIRTGALLPVGANGEAVQPRVTTHGATMFGSPRFESDAPSAFVFLGVPFDRNVSGRAGARFGPQALRSASEAARYQVDANSLEPVGFHQYSTGRTILKGVSLADAGDVLFHLGEPLEAAYSRISEVVAGLAETGAIPIILGGDHSITYPVIRALPAERLGIIHFDAHTDLGEIKSGELHHGNVFSVILEKLEYVERLCQIGLRGLLEANAHTPEPRADVFGMDRLRREGVEAILAALPEDLPYYLSIDVDVVDPAFAPSTGTPVPGGLFPHELRDLVHEVAKRRDILGCDIVEVGPELGPADGTAALAVEVLLSVADGIVRGLGERLDGMNGGARG